MGRSIIKPKPDEDFYVLYSTVVDLPVFWGTRKKMLKYSKKNWDGALWVPKTADLDRADRTESPVIEDDKIVWNGLGTLPVTRIKKACKMLDKGIDPMDQQFLDMLDRDGWILDNDD